MRDGSGAWSICLVNGQVYSSSILIHLYPYAHCTCHTLHLTNRRQGPFLGATDGPDRPCACGSKRRRPALVSPQVIALTTVCNAHDALSLAVEGLRTLSKCGPSLAGRVPGRRLECNRSIEVIEPRRTEYESDWSLPGISISSLIERQQCRGHHVL
jgi:hypothetical protein